MYLWWIYSKQIYFNMVWYLNELCKNAYIWYTCFSWCSLIVKNKFANLFLKAHFVMQYFSWSELFSKIHRNEIFNRIADANFESQRKLNKGLIAQWTEGGSTSACLWTQWTKGGSVFGSLWYTIYLVLIFCVTINFILCFYFYFYFRK